VAWGLLHGAYLVLQRLLAPLWRRAVERLRLPAAAERAILAPVVFVLTSFAWIFFRADSFQAAWTVITRIASLDGMSPASVPLPIVAAKGLVLIGGLVALEVFMESPRLRESYAANRKLAVAGASCLLWMIAFLGTFSGGQFIYFQF
jgi:hypothetical protein